ncbi:MAG: flagellar export chaperone FliS [Acidimicrobiia bacterium]
MSSAAARRQYSQDGLGVVSNARLLILLYERLDRDLAEAGRHCALGDRAGCHSAVVHAQEILYELIGALDVDEWDVAKEIQKIYVFCLNEIIEANLEQNAARIEASRQLLLPLIEAFRTASITNSEPSAVRQ